MKFISARLHIHREWIAIWGAMLGAFMAVLDIVITNVAINDIQGALSTTVDEASLISTSYLVPEIIMIPLSGWLMRTFSLRRFYLFSITLFTFSSLLCSFAWNLESMIVFRAMQGFGGGALIPLGFTVIMTTLPIEKRPMGMALFSLTATVAPALGPTLGGWLVSLYDWRYIFYLNIPAGVLMFAMLAFGLDKTKANWSLLKEGDYTGILSMAVGFSTLVIMLERGRKENWFESNQILTLAIISCFSLMLFVYIELRKKNPLVNLRLFAQRDFLLGSGANALMGLGLLGPAFILPLYLANIHDFTSMQIGIVFMWMGLPQLLLVPLVPRLMRHFDARVVAAAGFAVFSISCFMTSNLSVDFGAEQLILPQLLRAIGQPLAMVPLTVITVQQIAQSDIPSASSLFNLTRKLGGAISIAWLATVLDSHTTIHFAHIGETVGAISDQTRTGLAELTQTLINQGVAPLEAQQKAFGLLVETIKREARILAFGDTMFLTGAGLALACVLVAPISKPSTAVKNAQARRKRDLDAGNYRPSEH
jgi:DHA2 family multidrug resistance protein